jgi:hypothetical protein
MRQNVSWYLRDDHVDPETGAPDRMTFGSGGAGGRFGGARPCGIVRLYSWEGGELITRRIKCRSYRRAVRVLRWHLMGYKV